MTTNFPPSPQPMMFHHSNLVFLLILLLITSVSSLKVIIDSEATGKFHIRHGAQSIFEGGAFAVFVGGHWCIPDANATHQLTPIGGLEKRRGHDDTLGPFTALIQEWECRHNNSDESSTRIVTTIQNYDSESDIVFQVSYPQGALNTSTSSWTGSMAHWPLIRNTTLASTLAWQGTFMNPLLNTIPQGSNGGPIVFYNDTDVDLSTVIIASVWNGNWKSFSSGDGMDHAGNTALWSPGTSARIKRLPKHYQQSFILHASSGITNTVSEWGNALQQSRQSHIKLKDVTLAKIGYQTDNGAYYCFCQEQNCSQVLIDTIQNLRSQDIHMGYLSFQGAGASSGRGTAAPWCVETWGVDGGLSKNYPISVKKMQHAIGIPLQLYAPYFCPNTPYFTSKYQKISSNTSLPSCNAFDFENVEPKQARAFYDDFFARGIAAGMVSYESDFMTQNYNCLEEFVTTTTAAEMWQSGMAKAAASKNVTIQWCMATPSDVFASLDYPAVTNFRVSPDYCGGTSWNIGISSLLVWALGSAPSKDTLWTSTNNRFAIPGCPWTPDHEAPGAELHVILAIMSTGPVGISDANNMTNATLVKRIIARDGTLLKPARAITAVDSSFLDKAKSGLHGYVYGTAGYLGRSWHFVSFKLKQSYKVRLRDFFPLPSVEGDDDDVVLAYRFFHSSPQCIHGADALASGCIQKVVLNSTTDSSTPIFVAPRSNFDNVTGGSDFMPTVTTVWRSCHPINEWILLGELDKYVPISPARFEKIACIENGLAILIRGTIGEPVAITLVDGRGNVVVANTTIRSASGKALLRFERETIVSESL